MAQPDGDDAELLTERSVDRFVDRLSTLPTSEWLLAGALAKDTAAQRGESIRNLEQLITSRRLGVSAWLATDAVATAAYLAFPSCERTGSRLLELTARRAAEVAAHALLVRDGLSSKEFALLYLPFLTIIPPEFL